MRRPSLSAALLAAAFLVVAADARSLPAQPKRPKVVVDTNDALAYLDFGMQNAISSPNEAAAAFYWSSRLDPASAMALYGRRIALIVADQTLLREFMRDGKPSKRMLQVDSLLLRAVMLDPFLYRKLDTQLLTHAIRESVQQANGGRVNRSELDFAIATYLTSAGPYTRGWMAYGDGDYERALAYYADAMKRTKEKAGYRIERGRIFGIRLQTDSAVAEFRSALDELRKRDAKDLVVLYNSKAVVEQSIGRLLEQSGDVDGAREAYGRALSEDLSYWPAHLQLAHLAVAAHDTATAASEAALAMQLAEREPFVRTLAAGVLRMIGRYDESIAELKKASVAEPLYALPYFHLAATYEAKRDYGAALSAYDAFLARAGQRDPRRDEALARRAALRAAGGA